MLSISLDVPLRESKVDDEDLVGGFIQAYTKIVRLDVSVDEVPVVDVLDARDHLVDQHEHGLQRKLPQSFVEQVFEGGAHQIHDEDVIVACIFEQIPSVEQ
jgi:hypothetical protein